MALVEPSKRFVDLRISKTWIIAPWGITTPMGSRGSFFRVLDVYGLFDVLASGWIVLQDFSTPNGCVDHHGHI
jgi:hypothetical protein